MRSRDTDRDICVEVTTSGVLENYPGPLWAFPGIDTFLDKTTKFFSPFNEFSNLPLGLTRTQMTLII